MEESAESSDSPQSGLWCRRRKVGEGAGEKSSDREQYESEGTEEGVVRRLISIPMNAKGAQQARAMVCGLRITGWS